VARKLIGGRRLRWDDERAAAAYAQGWWIEGTLADAARKSAARTPQRVALIDGARRLTCADLYQQATALAHTLLVRIPPDSVVSFMLPNWHEAAVIYLATTLAGMVANPILPSLRDRELRFILEDADSRVVFVPEVFGRHDFAAMLQRVTAQLESPPDVVVVRGDCHPGQTPFDSLMTQSSASLPSLDPDAVRMILYTSGTSGRPKGVLHSHNSIHALLRQIGDHWLVEPGDVFLVASPIAHIGGSIYAFEAPFLLDSAAVLIERWDADEAVRLVVAERCTHIAGATPFLEHLLAAAQAAETRLSDLKVFICGGASVSPALIRRAATYLESTIVTRVYGSTEVPVTTVGSPGDADHAADTDGRPGVADVKLVGGEILVRGPQMLTGYLHPEDEDGSFDTDGYFRTGDLGRWVDNDYLVVTGRAKDIIIRNGENISPKEVEDVLAAHPGIAEVAVVGLPDERTGERACAVVVPTTAPGPDVASLLDFLGASGVARFKVPEQVVIWDDLPKNDAGKVLKQQIKAVLMKSEH
jgi:acyl-CoA synthetase (AMP-forming)/AMP-acid ligase II